MIPGLGKQLQGANVDDRELSKVEAIVLSMTADERRRPEIINGSRRARIARGSGTTVQQVNQLLSARKQMAKMVKQMGKGKMPEHPVDRGSPEAPLAREKGPNGNYASDWPAWGRRRTRSTASSSPTARSPRDGRFIEIVGRYNPQTNPSTISLDAEKIQDWIGKGAQPSDSVKRLMKAQGL